MGIVKAKIPKVPKVMIWPANMIFTSTNTFAFAVTAQYTAQPSPYPTIQWFKGRPMAMFEVFKPSLRRFIDILYNHLKAPSITSPGLFADGVFEFLQTFLARPAGSVLKMITEKVESLSLFAGVHQTGLARVQGQPSLLAQPRCQGQGR